MDALPPCRLDPRCGDRSAVWLGGVQRTPQENLRSGRGGVWRKSTGIRWSPTFSRPRFTILSEQERERAIVFFVEFGKTLDRCLVPGATSLWPRSRCYVALVAMALADRGWSDGRDRFGLVSTLRGGDRPKTRTTSSPTSPSCPDRCGSRGWSFVADQRRRCDEPPRVGERAACAESRANRRLGDVIKGGPATRAERRAAPHPSLDRRAFPRKVVRAVLPLGEGVVLDPSQDQVYPGRRRSCGLRRHRSRKH